METKEEFDFIEKKLKSRATSSNYDEHDEWWTGLTGETVGRWKWLTNVTYGDILSDLQDEDRMAVYIASNRYYVTLETGYLSERKYGICENKGTGVYLLLCLYIKRSQRLSRSIFYEFHFHIVSPKRVHPCICTEFSTCVIA